jgi:hypothetical protein
MRVLNNRLLHPARAEGSPEPGDHRGTAGPGTLRPGGELLSVLLSAWTAWLLVRVVRAARW